MGFEQVPSAVFLMYFTLPYIKKNHKPSILEFRGFLPRYFFKNISSRFEDKFPVVKFSFKYVVI